MKQSILDLFTRSLTTLDTVSSFDKIAILIGIAVTVHAIVKGVEYASIAFSKSKLSNRKKTIITLCFSLLVFTIYFIAIGLILEEIGISLSTYIASASVIGIAVGFGTQNLIQDVINGITIIISDLFTVGDMVEISGQTGIVQEVNMRFVILTNSFGAQVYIPARTVTNVINYPRGYLRCLVDIRLTSQDNLEQFKSEHLNILVASFTEQFPGILRAQPEISDTFHAKSGKSYIRVKFRIWPNRGTPIETTFRQDIIEKLRLIDPNTDPNCITVNYEISA